MNDRLFLEYHARGKVQNYHIYSNKSSSITYLYSLALTQPSQTDQSRGHK